MKREIHILIGCLLVTSLFFVTGCTTEHDDKGKIYLCGSVPCTEEEFIVYTNGGNDDTSPPPADPEGTITLSVRNGNNGSTKIPVQNMDQFYIDKADNFSSLMSISSNSWYFANVGKIRGLGDIKKIPDSGWSITCAVMPGYGYVGVGWSYNPGHSNYITFVRMYVDSEIIGASSGGIIGFVMKYQYPFNGTATAIGLSSKSITLDKINEDSYNNNSHPISLNKVSCTINPVEKYYGVFSFDGTKVNLVIRNEYQVKLSNPTMTVYSSGLPDEKIVVSP